MTMLLVYLFSALFLSFLCSLLESVLLSISAGHVNAMAEKGESGGKLMQRLKANPERGLAAILSLNTVAHTIGAAGVGAQVVHLWGDKWLGLASVVMTVLILVLTEIIPKTLGAMHARKFVAFTAFTVRVLIIAMFPLVAGSELLSRVLTRGRHAISVSRDELAAMADIGSRGGTLSIEEATAIRNLLALRDIRLSDIMTPRTAVHTLPAEQTVAEFTSSNASLPFARMPVIEDGNLDRVVGMLHRSMLLDALRKGEGDRRFRDMVRPIRAEPLYATASTALGLLLNQREHLLLVVDEYGGVAGVVSLEDIMETLLGVEIVGETDIAVDMREVARKLQQKRMAARDLAAPRGLD